MRLGSGFCEADTSSSTPTTPIHVQGHYFEHWGIIMNNKSGPLSREVLEKGKCNDAAYTNAPNTFLNLWQEFAEGPHMSVIVRCPHLAIQCKYCT